MIFKLDVYPFSTQISIDQASTHLTYSDIYTISIMRFSANYYYEYSIEISSSVNIGRYW